MNMKLNSATRLTDSLERELLACAILEQQQYDMGKALKSAFTKIATFFKGPKVTLHHATHTAN
ncbi:hypothetical protein KVP09_00775 [Alcaligenaceae bacterium CGII-47]|nr:hypothetical protein [Alcaligenaceae bacterium CGII-47]